MYAHEYSTMEIQAEFNADGELVATFPEGISMGQMMNASLSTNVSINGAQSLQTIRLGDLIDPNKSMISMTSDDKMQVRSKKRLTGSQKRALKRSKREPDVDPEDYELI